MDLGSRAAPIFVLFGSNSAEPALVCPCRWRGWTGFSHTLLSEDSQLSSNKRRYLTELNTGCKPLFQQRFDQLDLVLSPV